MGLNQKNIFLIDGAGALTTALLLGLVLLPFESFFGMPSHIVQALAIAAGGLSVYSFCCHFMTRKFSPVLLRIVMIANLSYCLFAAVLTVLNFKLLSIAGIAYFVGEIIVVLWLVKREYHVLSKGH